MFKGKEVNDVEQLRRIAFHLYKYQNFRPDAMLEPVKTAVKKDCNVDELRYADLTIKNFHAWLRSYIKNGQVPKRRNNKVFFDVVKELQQKCFQPLIPSEEDKARQPRQYKRYKTPVKTMTLDEIETPKVTAKPTHIELSQEALNSIANNSKKVSCYGLMFEEAITVLGVPKKSKVLKVFNTIEQVAAYAEAYTEKAAYNNEEPANFECVKISYSVLTPEEISSIE